MKTKLDELGEEYDGETMSFNVISRLTVEAIEKDNKKIIVDAWSILEHIGVDMRPKKIKEVMKRDIEQRKDELGLIYSAMFNMSYNDSIKEIKQLLEVEK